MMKAERELKQNGYSFYKSSKNPEEAKQIAKTLRNNGNLARVLKQGTNVIGLYEYSIYTKEKK